MALNFANNNSLSAITSTPSGVGGGSLNLISTQTASSSSTISFTSGLDSTYKEYLFKFIDIHGSEDDKFFQVNFRDGGTDYDATKTTTVFRAYHFETAGNPALQSRSADNEEGQSGETAYQPLGYQGGAVADENCSGELFLFDPSSTTFVKHFMCRNAAQGYDSGSGGFQQDYHVAGYFNTTSAIDAVSFKFSAGNIDSGTIEMYGIN